VARLKIENADYTKAGQYLCYGFPADRSTYAVKTFNIEIEDGSGGEGGQGGGGGGDGDGSGGIRPDGGDKLKRADIDSTVDLACEFSSEDVTDLKWRKLDGVGFLYK
jgi:hypothetical protein